MDAFGKEQTESSLGGARERFSTAAAENDGDWDLRYTLAGLSTERGQNCIVMYNIRGLVRRAGFLAPNNSLNVVLLGECGFHDFTTLMKFRSAVSRDWAEAESKMAE